MFRFLKFIIIAVIVVALGQWGSLVYINSDSFAKWVQYRASKELGNTVTFDEFEFKVNGNLTLKGLRVLSSNEELVLSVAKVKGLVLWSDLLSQDFLPQKVDLYGVDIDFRVKDSVWPLAILNEKSVLPPSPHFYLQAKDLNLHLNKLDAYLKKYELLLDFAEVKADQAPTITRLSTKGVISEQKILLESLDFSVFSGRVKSNLSIFLSAVHKLKRMEVGFNLSEIDLAKVGEFAKLDPIQVTGDLAGRGKVVLDQGELNLDAELATGPLGITEPGLNKVVERLTHQMNPLHFDYSRVKVRGRGHLLTFSQLELRSKKVISLCAPATKITLDQSYHPTHVVLPLRLSAPYKLIKWRDYLMPGNPDFIEIPIDLDCELTELKPSLINALIYTIQKHSLKKSMKKLEDKLGFKIEDQPIDVKKILDSKAYTGVKQKVRKKVDRVDLNQVNQVIDVLGKDSKKKEKIKKNIDLFMQFLK
jgi:hypothetical protein